jgi:hypothetical protein
LAIRPYRFTVFLLSGSGQLQQFLEAELAGDLGL